MASGLKVIYQTTYPGSDALLVVYVRNATPNKEDEYTCEVSEFLRDFEAFDKISCQALLYQYSTHVTDSFRWQDLLDSSYDLIEHLQPFCTASRDANRPLIFVGEGLGGLVVKQALWNARKQLYRYRSFLEQVSGIVFLITPHLGNDAEDTGAKLGTILRQYSKTASQKAVSQDFLKPYEICAQRFEELGLTIPILSLYETENSRNRSSRLTHRKRVLVVDTAFAATNSMHEQLLGLDVPLKQLLDPATRSHSRYRIITFIQDLFAEARERLQTDLREDQGYQVRIPSMKTPTPAPSLPDGETTSDSSRKQSSSTQDGVLLTPQGLSSSTPKSGGTRSISSFQLVEAMAGLETESRSVKLPCHFTKPHARNKTFYPRQDVVNLMESKLLVSKDNESLFDSNLKTFVLCGIGGLGKTETALEFVFSHLENFDAVFIFHADQAATLAEEFSRAAIQLGLQQNNAADPQDSRELLKEWFADPRKAVPDSGLGKSEQDIAKWLVVFDNADDPDVLSLYWPVAGVGSVLVTSRNPMAKTDFFFGQIGLELGTFSLAESTRWILQLSGADLNDPRSVDAAKIIAQKLDGLPLAITQISSIIRMRQLRLTEFIKLYENDTDLAELQSIRLGNGRGYEHSLASVWALDNLEPCPRLLLNVISMLDPDRIQEEILTTPPPDLYGLKYPMNQREYHVNLTPLLQSSLVCRHSVNAELSIHRLVTDVTREAILKCGDFAKYFKFTVDLLCRLWPFLRVGMKTGAAHDVTRWPRCGSLYPHVLRLFQRFHMARDRVPMIVEFVRFADLILEAAWYQAERSNFNECEPLLSLAEEIYEQTEPKRYEELAVISGSRASILHWKNNGEDSLFHAEKSLQLSKEACSQSGQQSIELSYSWYGIGLSLNLCRLYSKAIPCFERISQIRKALPGFVPLHEFGAKHQIGISLFGLGLFQQSEDVLRQNIALFESIKGKNDTSSFRPAPSCYTLGLSLASQGKLDESFQWHKRAMNHLIATSGDTHIFTAPTYVAVAEHLLRFGEYQDAQILIDKALRIYQKHSEYVEDLAKVYFLYGRILRGQGVSATPGGDAASEMFDKAANSLNEIHPYTKRLGNHLTEQDFYGLGTIGFT